MRYEDEAWIRLYVRDTMTWLSWSWEAQGLFCCLIRKLDRAGLMPLDGYQADLVVSIQTRWPLDVVKKALPQLMRPDQDGVATIAVVNDCLIATRFVEAQNATNSGAKRSKEFRARKRELARAEKYGVRPALRVNLPRDFEDDALENEGARDTLPEQEESPFSRDEPFDDPPANGTESPYSTGRTFTEHRDSVSAQTTETPDSGHTETPDSTVTERYALKQTVASSNGALCSVTNRREEKRQREKRGSSGVSTDQNLERASAPALSVGFAKETPAAQARPAGEPREVGQVFDWLLDARKQVQPRARRESCSPHTIELVLRPMKKLNASLLDWKRAIDGQLADVKKQKDRDKYRYLSLDTLSKPENFRRALENADAHGILQPLSEAQVASERAAQERAEAEAEAAEAERLERAELEAKDDDRLIADAEARLALLDAEMGFGNPAERAAP